MPKKLAEEIKIRKAAFKKATVSIKMLIITIITRESLT